MSRSSLEKIPQWVNHLWTKYCSMSIIFGQTILRWVILLGTKYHREFIFSGWKKSLLMKWVNLLWTKYCRESIFSGQNTMGSLFSQDKILWGVNFLHFLILPLFVHLLVLPLLYDSHSCLFNIFLSPGLPLLINIKIRPLFFINALIQPLLMYCMY